jgi:uncharacterized membrane protein
MILSMVVRTLARWLLGLAFFAAGIPHFTQPESYLPMMPPYLPWHRELIFVSGTCEILGGLGVLWPNQKIQRAAGLGLIALLAAIFPANLHMALNDAPMLGRHFSAVVRWGRLPLQFALMAWAWWATRSRPRTL